MYLWCSEGWHVWLWIDMIFSSYDLRTKTHLNHHQIFLMTSHARILQQIYLWVYEAWICLDLVVVPLSEHDHLDDDWDGNDEREPWPDPAPAKWSPRTKTKILVNMHLYLIGLIWVNKIYTFKWSSPNSHSSRELDLPGWRTWMSTWNSSSLAIWNSEL